MTDGHTELADRLTEIEGKPLADRATAYAALHDELAARLESAPVDGRR
ncbi:hypothetical protein QWJ90_14025 [Microbacterium oryzae]|nr:hypothetical protein [Microbacterium oryzae]MDN3312048.1 hypothetical protein [Microbacterium oryzae]